MPSSCPWAMPQGMGLFDIHVGSDPIMRCCRVSLAGNVFCEEYVTGTKSHAGAVAKPDVDCTREGNDPATSRRSMPIYNMWREIISKEKSCG